ncbi:MAG: hypothetical protein IT320_24845 [Anaerolineae bacterium]|nr:hypothetical protein [Anaerolineae bacterium]
MRRCVTLLAVGLLLALSACNLSTEAPTPTPERIVPTVEFLYPTNGSLVVEGTDVQIELLAQDSRGSGVARVELYVDDQPHQDGAPVVSSAVSVFTVDMNWLAEGVGLHALSAIAYRADGTASDAATISLEVISRDDTGTANAGS